MIVNDLLVLEEEQLNLPPTEIVQPGYITVRQLKKEFRDAEGQHITVLNGIDFEIARGEFVAVFGPNGCGKTTLLRILSGLDAEWTGEAVVDGQTPANAACGFVFQDYQRSLLPWLTNLRNLCLPLELKHRTSRPESEQRVHQLLNNLQLGDDWLTKYPYRSNAGEQQLVSFLRAFISVPQLVLMDEPFTSLDFHHQMRLREVLLALWRETKQTILFVSHTLEDSIYLADRLLVLSPKPARLILDYRIPLPRPRDPQVVKSRLFSEIVSEVRAKFLEESI
jgi:NitT/TauT family transport system ATP-binding protein